MNRKRKDLKSICNKLLFHSSFLRASFFSPYLFGTSRSPVSNAGRQVALERKTWRHKIRVSHRHVPEKVSGIKRERERIFTTFIEYSHIVKLNCYTKIKTYLNYFNLKKLNYKCFPNYLKKAHERRIKFGLPPGVK